MTTQGPNEAEALRQKGSGGATSNVVVQADVALRLATEAVQIQELTVERDADQTTAAEADTVVQRLTGKVKAMTTEVNTPKAQKGTLKSQVEMLRGGRTRDRAEIKTITTRRDAAQTDVRQLGDPVDGFEVARRDVNAVITRLRGEIREMERLRTAWCRERRDIGVRAQFAVQ